LNVSHVEDRSPTAQFLWPSGRRGRRQFVELRSKPADFKNNSALPNDDCPFYGADRLRSKDKCRRPRGPALRSARPPFAAKIYRQSVPQTVSGNNSKLLIMKAGNRGRGRRPRKHPSPAVVPAAPSPQGRGRGVLGAPGAMQPEMAHTFQTSERVRHPCGPALPRKARTAGREGLHYVYCTVTVTVAVVRPNWLVE